MENLEKCFEEAKEQDSMFIGVKIEMQGFPKPEVIINHRDNFDAKLEYYKKAYNDNLTLKAFNGIKIIDFAHGNSFDAVEQFIGGLY